MTCLTTTRAVRFTDLRDTQSYVSLRGRVRAALDSPSIVRIALPVAKRAARFRQTYGTIVSNASSVRHAPFSFPLTKG